MFGKPRARLEIELPSGITLVYEDEAALADGKPMPRWALMAKMRAAIGATDFGAVQALYGEKPLLLTNGGEATGAQLGGDAARPKPTPIVKKTPTAANPPPTSGSIGATQQPGTFPSG